jgi:hypothetical protein
MWEGKKEKKEKKKKRVSLDNLHVLHVDLAIAYGTGHITSRQRELVGHGAVLSGGARWLVGTSADLASVSWERYGIGPVCEALFRFPQHQGPPVAEFQSQKGVCLQEPPTAVWLH